MVRDSPSVKFYHCSFDIFVHKEHAGSTENGIRRQKGISTNSRKIN
jgi:hypothetical protein